MERSAWRGWDLAVLAGLFLLIRVAVWVGGPVVVGVALAAAAEPQVNALVRWAKLPRSLAMAVVLIVWIGLVAVLLGDVGTHLLAQAALFADRAPRLASALRSAFGRFLAQVPPAGALQPSLQEALRTQMAGAAGLLPRLMSGGLGIASAVPSFIAQVAVAVAAAYLVGARGPISDWLKPLVRSLPGEMGLRVERVGSAAAQAAYGLIRAELLLAFGTAVSSTLLLSLRQSPYALLLGAVAGALDLVPYAGPAALFLPWAFFLAITGHVRPAIGMAFGWAALAAVRALLELHLVGRGVGLTAFAVLASLFIGGRFFGPAGMFLGPVVAAAGLAVWHQGEVAATALRIGPKGRGPSVRRGTVPFGSRAASKRGYVLSWRAGSGGALGRPSSAGHEAARLGESSLVRSRTGWYDE